MSIRNTLAITMVAFLAPMVFASTASAQAGAGCGTGALAPTSCGLGGQIRGQIGDGLPLPISIAPAQGGSGSLATNGPFTAITIQSGPATPNGLALVGKGLGQPGQIKPTTMATIMQTTALGPFTSMNPAKLTLGGGATSMGEGPFHYGGQPQGSIGVVNFNVAVFAVQTNLTYDTPHPGFKKTGAAATIQSNGALIGNGPVTFKKNGRAGASTVSFYNSATVNGTAGTNFGNQTPNGAIITAKTAMAGETGVHPINGIARFTNMRNQFGGEAIGRAVGTAKVYFNGAPLAPLVDLPCAVSPTPGQTTPAQGNLVLANPNCQFSLSIVDLTGSNATVGVAGGKFGGLGTGTAFTTNTGVFTGTIGFNGTIINKGLPVTAAGINVPFTGQGNQAVGMPATTGMLSVTVDLVVGVTSEMFIRTGIDARDAAGNGVVALVTGSMTARDISSGNANRTWITLEIPEPSAILAASAGLFALFGCHRLARRRS